VKLSNRPVLQNLQTVKYVVGWILDSADS